MKKIEGVRAPEGFAMRILVFSELFYPHGGGAELATWLYSKLLAEEGFEITAVTRQFPNETSAELLDERITIFRIPMKVTFGSRYDSVINAGVLANSFVNKLIAKNDVVYIPCGWYSAIPIARLHKKPVVVHLHNYSIVCPTSLMYNFVKQEIGRSSRKSFLLHEIVEKKREPFSVFVSSLINDFLGKYYNKLGMLSDALIFVSNAQRDLVLSEVPNLNDKSYVIYNPIPNHALIEAEETGIGYFGGRSFVKGFHTLMRALKSIKCSNHMTVYMTMTSIEQKTVKIGDGIRVNLLPRLSHNDFLGLMKRLSVVVIPSLWPEPLPYTLIESMLHGKLVIASNNGGIPEIVDADSLGVKIVKPGDHAELVDSLVSFSKLGLEKANRIGAKNREDILQEFDNKRTIDSFIEALERVVSTSGLN